jgi:alkylation response protein AidB-like acyl-CoA dehydrogenase
MNFAATGEQQALRESVKRFVERGYGFERRAGLLHSDEGFERADWATYAELGWLGAGLSEAEGGFGGGPAETAVIAEELGRALAVEPYLSSAVIATRAVVATAAHEQRGTLVEALIAGETLAALAHGEPQMDGGEGEVATTARRTPDGWVIEGAKQFVLGAPSADLLLISARTDAGISLFQVPRDATGVTVKAYHAVDGRRVADIALAEVAVAPTALLGEDGAALPAIELAIDHGVVALMAEAVGAMDAALWLTRDYLLERRQFGVALASFQALQHRMADMLVEVELSGSILALAVHALGDADATSRRAHVSAAKVQIADAAIKVTGEAIQLHGGIGMTEEYVVGHYYKHAMLVRGLFGTPDRHLERFAAHSQGQAA